MLQASIAELRSFVKGPGGRAGRGWRLLGLMSAKLAEVDPGADRGAMLMEARSALEKSNALLDDPDTIHALGVVSARLGESARAVRLFEEAISKGSVNVKSYLGPGLASYDLGEYGKAVCYLKKYVKLADDGAEHLGYRVLGLACFKEGDLGCARAYLKRASFTADDAATIAETEYYLGNIALEGRAPDEAERHYRKALEAEPNYHGVLRDLARDFEAKGEDEKARAVRRVVGQ